MSEDNVYVNGFSEQRPSLETAEYSTYNTDSVVIENYPEYQHPDENNKGSVQTHLIKDSDNDRIGVRFEYGFTASVDVDSVSFSVGPLGLDISNPDGGFDMEATDDPQ